MNEPLDPFWVFTFLGVILSIFILRGAITLHYDRESWKFSDLGLRFAKQAGVFLVLFAGVSIFNTGASIENLEPYPYLKIVGFIAVMAAFRSVTGLAGKITKESEL